MRLCLLFFLLLNSILAFSIEDELAPIIKVAEKNGGKIGIYLYDIKSKKKIFTYKENLQLNPASNMKILTTGAALWKLETDYIFKTEFYTDKLPQNGKVDGNLYIKGYGDPTIVTETLYAIGQALKARGIKEIVKDIIIDNTFIESSNSINEGFPTSRAFNPPITALSLNRNAYTISVYPSLVGQKPKIVLESEKLDIVIINNAVTVKGNSSAIEITGKYLDKEYIYVNGKIGENANSKNIYRAVINPTQYFGIFFKEVLNSLNIKFSGIIKGGFLPQNPPFLIYTHNSRDISHIIKDMNEFSNNFYAEILLRTMGAFCYGAPGSTDKGLMVIRSFLSNLGINNNYTIENGSGLSLNTKLSVNQFGRVLEYLYENFQYGSEFVSSLSITGMRGTLRKRYKDVEGLIRAKSGFLDYIYALSGFALNKQDKTTIFSIIINGPISYNDSLELFDNFAIIISDEDKSIRFIDSEFGANKNVEQKTKHNGCFYHAKIY